MKRFFSLLVVLFVAFPLVELYGMQSGEVDPMRLVVTGPNGEVLGEHQPEAEGLDGALVIYRNPQQARPDADSIPDDAIPGDFNSLCRLLQEMVVVGNGRYPEMVDFYAQRQAAQEAAELARDSFGGAEPPRVRRRNRHASQELAVLAQATLDSAEPGVQRENRRMIPTGTLQGTQELNASRDSHSRLIHQLQLELCRDFLISLLNQRTQATFVLNIEGCYYLVRAQRVMTADGQPAVCCAIALLQGGVSLSNDQQ